MGSVVGAHGLRCPSECWILPDQGSKPSAPHWQEWTPKLWTSRKSSSPFNQQRRKYLSGCSSWTRNSFVGWEAGCSWITRLCGEHDRKATTSGSRQWLPWVWSVRHRGDRLAKSKAQVLSRILLINQNGNKTLS